MNNDKKKILVVLLIISLLLNCFLAFKLFKNGNYNNASNEKMVEDYVNKQPTDDSTLKEYLSLLAEDNNTKILNKENEDVTDDYKDKLLEFYNNEDFKGAREFMLEKNLSISN